MVSDKILEAFEFAIFSGKLFLQQFLIEKTNLLQLNFVKREVKDFWFNFTPIQNLSCNFFYEKKKDLLTLLLSFYFYEIYGSSVTQEASSLSLLRQITSTNQNENIHAILDSILSGEQKKFDDSEIMKTLTELSSGFLKFEGDSGS
jgi:hypothetical protein